MSDGVDGMKELSDVLTYELAAYSLLVDTVEIGVEREIDLFFGEMFPSERQICGGRVGPHIVVAHILEHLAVV